MDDTTDSIRKVEAAKPHMCRRGLKNPGRCHSSSVTGFNPMSEVMSSICASLLGMATHARPPRAPAGDPKLTLVRAKDVWLAGTP